MLSDTDRIVFKWALQDEEILDRLAFAVEDYLTRMHGIVSSQSLGHDEARRILAHAFEMDDQA